GVEPQQERLDRLDLEPAVDAPVAQRGVAPCVERRLELIHPRDVEVGELRAEATRIDDAVAEVPFADRHMGSERSTNELRIRVGPRQTGEDADMAALVEAVPPGASRDLRDLPRLEVAPLLAVELRRLGEEERLAREVDAVAEDVGRGAHLCL